MDKKEKILKLKEEEYQKYFGVKKEIFEKMLEVLNRLVLKPQSLEKTQKFIVIFYN